MKTLEEMIKTLADNELQMRIRELEAKISDMETRYNAKKDPLKKRSAAHTRYRLADGTIVPGTTTITGLKDKSGFLVPWANKLGLEGIDSSKYTEDAAGVGTLAHAMVEARLTGRDLDLNQYSQETIDLAENALLSYLEWEKQHTIEAIANETPMVSEELKYGGTIDCYCILDGVPTLLDIKTGKAIYDEYFMQLAAYKNLLEENGMQVDRCMILRIGRDETEGFEIRSISDTTLDFAMFKDLLSLYYHDKEKKAQQRAMKKELGRK